LNSSEDNLQNPASEWKNRVMRDVQSWLETLDEQPSPSDQELPEVDLYSIFQQLTILKNEQKTASRKNNELLKELSDSLNDFSHIMTKLELCVSSPLKDQEKDENNRQMTMIDLYTRLERLHSALASPPKVGLFNARSRYRQSWQNLAQGFDIVCSHLEQLLKKQGIEKISTLGQEFDPQTMVAIATEKKAGVPENWVSAEVSPGFSCNNQILKLAEVKIARK